MLSNYCVVAPPDLFRNNFTPLDLLCKSRNLVVRLLLFIQKLPLSLFELFYKFVFLLDDSFCFLYAEFHLFALLGELTELIIRALQTLPQILIIYF